MININNHHP